MASTTLGRPIPFRTVLAQLCPYRAHHPSRDWRACGCLSGARGSDLACSRRGRACLGVGRTGNGGEVCHSAAAWLRRAGTKTISDLGRRRSRPRRAFGLSDASCRMITFQTLYTIILLNMCIEALRCRWCWQPGPCTREVGCEGLSVAPDRL